MALRFIDTTVWSEDWFCELGNEYQNFWNYITCMSDNAGIWKPNRLDFEIKSRIKINMVAFLEKINERGCKERIFITETGRWFITGFIMFQWFNKKDSFDLVLSNKLHKHIYNLLIKNQIPIKKVRGLREVLETSKDKDKDKEEKRGVGKKEGNPVGIELANSTAKEAYEDVRWRESVCISNYIKPDEMAKWMRLFNESIACDVVEKFDENRYKKMFPGWMQMRRSNGRKLPEKNTGEKLSAPPLTEVK